MQMEPCMYKAINFDHNILSHKRPIACVGLDSMVMLCSDRTKHNRIFLSSTSLRTQVRFLVEAICNNHLLWFAAMYWYKGMPFWSESRNRDPCVQFTPFITKMAMTCIDDGYTVCNNNKESNLPSEYHFAGVIRNPFALVCSNILIRGACHCSGIRDPCVPFTPFVTKMSTII
jgi:hypothetical protein